VVLPTGTRRHAGVGLLGLRLLGAVMAISICTIYACRDGKSSANPTSTKISKANPRRMPHESSNHGFSLPVASPNRERPIAVKLGATHAVCVMRKSPTGPLRRCLIVCVAPLLGFMGPLWVGCRLTSAWGEFLLTVLWLDRFALTVTPVRHELGNDCDSRKGDDRRVVVISPRRGHC
jgi:hypothetical protein